MEQMSVTEQQNENVAGLARNSERGAAMVEYALLITFIAIVAVAALTLLGSTVSGSFSEINSGFAN